MALYSDLDISFTPDPITGDLAVVSDEQSVTQSVKNLILTSFYERPFQPSLGSAVNLMLFENNDEVTRFILAQKIKQVVDLFEPRAEVKLVDIYDTFGPKREKLDPHTLIINVGFLVQNFPTLVTTQIILRRLR